LHLRRARSIGVPKQLQTRHFYSIAASIVFLGPAFDVCGPLCGASLAAGVLAAPPPRRQHREKAKKTEKKIFTMSNGTLQGCGYHVYVVSNIMLCLVSDLCV
jgi:hypothetical protein